ncbi:MAG: radical SAM/SPASM domain-containing protein [Candidatus Scalindua sp.]
MERNKKTNINYLKVATLDAAKRLYKRMPSKWQGILYRRYLLKRFRQRRLPPVYLETTSACNLNCVMCPTQRTVAKRFKKDGFVDAILFRRLVDEIVSENPWISVFIHKDGEPLLHPEIVDLISYASSRLKNVILVTNATLLNEEMARAILATQLQHIRFSVDGLNKQTFEKIRKQSQNNPYADHAVPVDYESVVSNIKRFCELKKSLRRHYPIVGVRITNFKATQQELTDYTSYWKQMVDFIEVAELLSWTGQVTQETCDYSQRYPCSSLWAYMTINWDGTMVPCCTYVDTTGDDRGILADLNTSSLHESWYSPTIQRLRMAHLDNDLERVAPFCILCRDWRCPSPDGEEVWSEKFKALMRSEIKKMING